MMMRNTAAEIQSDPYEIIAMGIKCENPGRAIELMEIQGQMELCRSTELPTDGSGHPAFSKMGVTFGPPHEKDPLFCDATIPEGWSIRPTNHSMWSDLVDDRGRIRASIFYKAAYYDRKAHMRPCRRYFCGPDLPTDVTRRSVVRDNGTDEIIFSTDFITKPPEGYTRDYLAACDAMDSEATAWINEHLPEWEDPSAYWDEEDAGTAQA
jgi:hypothetical protein